MVLSNLAFFIRDDWGHVLPGSSKSREGDVEDLAHGCYWDREVDYVFKLGKPRNTINSYEHREKTKLTKSTDELRSVPTSI